MLGRKIKILEDFLGSYYNSKDELLFNCPKCEHHKKKLSVNIDKDVFKCWVCDYNGRSITRLVFAYGGPQNREQWKKECGIVDFSEEEDKEPKPEPISLPEEFLTLTSRKSTPLSLSARAYLRSRGVSYDDILWWKIGYCPDGEYAGRVVVPSFDLEGEVNFFIARNYKDSFHKYKNPKATKDLIFNELYLDWNKDIVLVEGVFDAIVAGNAIPLLGSTLREDSRTFQKIVQNCSKVFVALDADVKLKEDKIIRLLLSYGVEVYKIDTSEYEDVGVMTKNTFSELKKKASLVSVDNYLLEKLRL